jgi:hypothetical protein
MEQSDHFAMPIEINVRRVRLWGKCQPINASRPKSVFSQVIVWANAPQTYPWRCYVFVHDATPENQTIETHFFTKSQNICHRFFCPLLQNSNLSHQFSKHKTDISATQSL